MAKLSKESKVTLNNGTKMPIVGFGTWKIAPGPSSHKAVNHALEAGYRHFDTARIYLNEKAIGKALKESGVPRKDLFVTTKLWNHDQGYEDALKAFNKSLKRLDMDYVDLYLLHWPVPEKRLESWKALVEIQKSGKAKAIGVSNFTEEQLAELLEHTDIVPAVNQVEYHPYLNQKLLRDFCKEKGTVITAYSPLAHGKRMQDGTLLSIAAKHAKSEPQIMLRWNLQMGNTIIPKSTDEVRIGENIDLFDFELDKEDMEAIGNLNENYRTCWDPTGM
jgi:diketogulonate reductase-like aldo/keto reductase